jgi:hypothetical protein
MARMLHRREAPAQGRQKVFIAIAAYQGCGAGFAWSLFHTGAALARAGIAYELALYTGNCHVDDSRNRLVRDFLDGDCTDLFFLDADLGWTAADFVRLLGFDRDVVAGVYPKKHGDDAFPVRTLPGEIWSDADGLIEVEGVPTGFLRIRRGVIEALAARAQTYNARNDGALATPCIFERQVHDGVRWGGDYSFCRKWRALGGRVFIDPTPRFEHAGEHTWYGSVGTWLRQRAGFGLSRGLDAVRNGAETVDDLVDLVDAWANPFAANPALLAALAMLAREGATPILECGSGLSTLVLAAANPARTVHSFEDNPVFANQVREEAGRYGLANIVVHDAPLRDGWYDLAQLPGAEWGLVFIDGPRRTTGGRAQAPQRIDLTRALVVADDVQGDGGVPELRAALEVTHRMLTFSAGGGSREFAVGVPKAAAREAAA